MPSVPNFRPVPTATAFVDHSQYGLALRTQAADKRKFAVAEEIYLYFANMDKWRRQAQDTVSEIKVERGETMWGIADREYGDGRLFVALAAYNKRSWRVPVQIGETLRVPTIEHLARTSAVAKRGDSVWALARGRLSQSTVVVDRLVREGRDPNLIYPGDIFPEMEPTARELGVGSGGQESR